MKNDAILKKQLMWTRICALCLFAILIIIAAMAVFAVPKLNSMHREFLKLSGITESLSKISSQLETADWEEISKNLADVSHELAEVDWSEFSDDVSELAVKAQESLDTAAEAVNKLDIESLNSAIGNLARIVEPLAGLVGKFG